ncbi:Serine/threonine protein kinase [Mycena venus]|uniref:non-specific serine/threonine protein kinase n=1 Tax=Mycena venus TaxID=2733690 RepID=A0A8H7CR33_9AGAR|nr:Serine/threonine protein kinase [Mycena venus]
MPSSFALIPWNQPGVNKAVATIDENSCLEGGKWAVILHGLLNPCPGRTLDRMYTFLGGVLEKKANEAAYTLGLGPHVVAEKIKSYFGNGDDKLQRLEALSTTTVPSKLEKQCSRLVRYALPTESASTQHQAFKEIVDLVTLFPGLRVYFLRAHCLDGMASMDDISALWSHPNGAPDDKWAFWRNFAAACLADTSVSAILETSSVPDLTKCQMNEGLSVIELLIIPHDCETGPASAFSNALCIRYLAGILDLQGFWLDTGSVHSDVARKLCVKMVQVLKDIGVDVIPSAESMEPESPFDYEGVDLLADKVLAGIISWFSGLQPATWILQPWYAHFREVVQLLRWRVFALFLNVFRRSNRSNIILRPRSALLLPDSFTRATSDACEIIVPTICQTVELDILVEATASRTGSMTMGVGSTCPSVLLMWDSSNDGRAGESLAGGQEEMVDAYVIQEDILWSPASSSLNTSVVTFISSPNRGPPSLSSLSVLVPSNRMISAGATSVPRGLLTPPAYPVLGTRIDNGSLELVEVLGVGGYGVVYRAIETNSPVPRQYAVKCLGNSQMTVTPRQRQLHVREIALHQLASAHPNVVNLQRVAEEGTYTYIIMDFAPDGNLFSQILYDCRYLGNTRLIRHIFDQLLDAVEYCHSLGIYHRDLKLENVLCFDGGYRIAITDFGLATTEKLSEEFRTGSTYYMSPECHGGEFAPSGTYSPMSNDVWSLGIVLLNLTTGRIPWEAATLSNSSFRAYLHDPSEFLPTVLPISAELNAVLVRVLELDWRRRMTIPELRIALERVTNFYSDDTVFDNNMARCPWEVGVDFGASGSPKESQHGVEQELQPHFTRPDATDSNSSSSTRYSSSGATWAFDSPSSSVS